MRLFLAMLCLVLGVSAQGQPFSINRGSAPGDGTGETLYSAFGKVNQNFAWCQGFQGGSLNLTNWSLLSTSALATLQYQPPSVNLSNWSVLSTNVLAANAFSVAASNALLNAGSNYTWSVSNALYGAGSGLTTAQSNAILNACSNYTFAVSNSLAGGVGGGTNFSGIVVTNGVYSGSGNRLLAANPTGPGQYLFTDWSTNAGWRDDGGSYRFDESFKATPSCVTAPSGMTASTSTGGVLTGVGVPTSFTGYGDRFGWCKTTVYSSNNSSSVYGYWGDGSSTPSSMWRSNSFFQADFVMTTENPTLLTNTLWSVGVVPSAGATSTDQTWADGVYLRLNPDVTTNFWCVVKRGGSSNALEVASVPALANQLYSVKIYGSTNWTRFDINGTNVANFFQQGGTNDALPTGVKLMPSWTVKNIKTNSAAAWFRVEYDRVKFQE